MLERLSTYRPIYGSIPDDGVYRMKKNRTFQRVYQKPSLSTYLETGVLGTYRSL